jgi:hypothetical protein
MSALVLIPVAIVFLFAVASLVADHYRKKYATVGHFGFY